MKGIRQSLATIVWICVCGLLEGCASRGGSPGAPSQLEPSHVGALEQVATQGKDGTVLLRMPTWLGDLQLEPGRYQFQQRLDRGEPLLHVIEVKRYANFKRPARDFKRFVADVKCRLEALGQTAAETAVHIRPEAGVARVDWITLAGEAGRYLPEAVRR